MLDGSSIRAAREAAGLTQAELAGELKVTPQAVSGWERNEASPDINNACAMASHLGVSVDDLARGRRTEPADQSLIEQVLRIALAAGANTPTHIMAALAAAGLVISRSDSLRPPDPASSIVDQKLFVKEVMERRNITPTKLAREVGLSPSTLNRFMYREDNYKLLSMRTLHKIKEWDRCQN